MRDETILYDLLVHCEWKKESELSQPTATDSLLGLLKSRLWALFPGKGYGGNRMPLGLRKLKFEQSLPWKVAVGVTEKSSTQLVAIALDDSVEVRASKDQFASIISKCIINRDISLSSRVLSWSPDCCLLLMAYSNGLIDAFDILGSKMFTISPGFASTSQGNEFLSSIVKLLFLPITSSDVLTDSSVHWNYKMIVATFGGQINCYYLNTAIGEYKEHFSFDFQSSRFSTLRAPGTVSDIDCHPLHPNLLFVAGSPCTSEDQPESLSYGLTIWRILSDYPFLKLVHNECDELSSSSSNFPFQWFIGWLPYNSTSDNDWVHKISLSRDSKLLVAAHESGGISLWDIPSLRLNQFWSIQDQSEEGLFQSMIGRGAKCPEVQDVDLLKISRIFWWNNRALLVCRTCGAVTISSTDPDFPLRNLLGDSPEFFEALPPPFVCPPFQDSFMCLECEVKIKNRSRRRSDFGLDSDQQDSEDEADDDDDEEESVGHSVLTSFSNSLKSALYLLTDSERFQPPKRKSKVRRETFRLVQFKLTTPEEIFTRKLNAQEYGEALDIARLYGLNSDTVYQRQWKNIPVSLDSITDFLSKIMSNSWVITECLERVPETIDATKALIEFGLKVTELENMVSLSESAASQRSPGNEEEYFASDEEYRLSLARRARQRREQLLKNFDPNSLTLDEKQFIIWRLKLLRYLDRLNTYEAILGGPHVSHQRYDAQFFEVFRNLSGLEAAVGFAHESNWKAVSAMFTYHGEETLEHRQPILSHFPETLSPFIYRSLLPECSLNEFEEEVYPCEEVKDREEDWSERLCSSLCDVFRCEDFEQEFYTISPELMEFKGKSLSKFLASKWYVERSKHIERCTSLVDDALQLVKLGIERNVPFLNDLHDDFETFATVVYECVPRYAMSEIDFTDFEKLAAKEKVQLLMWGAVESEQVFIRSIKQFLLPFLQTCDKRHENRPACDQLFHDYLVSIAKNDLSLCRVVFQNSIGVANSLEPSEVSEEPPLIESVENLLSFALDCIYACEQLDQLDEAFTIVECLPQRTPNMTPALEQLQDKADLLERHLAVAELLEKYDVHVSLRGLKEIQENRKEKEGRDLFVKVTRRGAKREKQPYQEKDWQQMLQDLHLMHKDCFEDCILLNEVNKIFVETLLTSGRRENFALAATLLHLRSSGTTRVIPFDESILIIVSAAKEYLNSANSMTDEVIHLAKECLLLIKKEEAAKNASVREELDFIEALGLLDKDFDVKLLPVQIRLMEQPRVEVIENILRSTQRGYKKSGKLLKVADLLRVCVVDVPSIRDAKVLSLIAEAAFNDADYDSCWSICQQMMASECPLGWKACQKLGNCEGFRNLEARLQLLSFALASCDDSDGEALSDILEAVRELRLNLLQQSTSSRASALGIITSSAQQLTAQLTDQLTGVSKGAQLLTGWLVPKLKARGRAQFVSGLQQVEEEKEEEEHQQYDQESSQVKRNESRITVPVFYSDAFSKTCASFPVAKESVDMVYTSYGYKGTVSSPSETLSLGQLLFRTKLLQNDTNNLTELLQELAFTSMFIDTPLALSYVLSLPDPRQVDSVFARFGANNPTALYLGLYSFSLLSCQSKQKERETRFEMRPAHEVISEALGLAQTEQPQSLVSTFVIKYNEMFLAVNGLLKVYPDVDLKRFEEDKSYREDSLLGLAMTTDDYTLEVVILLAKQHSIPLSEVYLIYVEYLMTSDEVAVPVVEEKVKSCLPFLQKIPSRVLEVFESRILPLIDDKDQQKLALYEDIVDQIDN